MELPPPATIVSHQKNKRELTLTNDFAGTANVYCCTSKDIAIFTNRPETVSMVLSEAAQISRKAWMQQASFDWIVNDETYWNGLHMLPPGQSMHMTSSGYSVSETHGFSNLLAVGSDQTLGKTADAIVGSIENARLMAEGNISTIGLSGGRDSRAIAAILKESNRDLCFTTSVPPDLEAVVASSLVRASSKPIKWDVLKRPVLAKPPKDSVEKRSTDWTFRTSGDSWSSCISTDFTPITSEGGLLISGGGGEVLRGNFYGKSDLDSEDDRVSEFIRHRKKYHPFLTQEARFEATNACQSVIDSGKQLGLKGLSLLEYFYIRSKQRRRVPIAFKPTTCFPLFNSVALSYAFLLNPGDRLNAKVQADLVEKFAPEWSNLPYFDELAHDFPSSETDKTEVIPYFWEGSDREEFIDLMEVILPDLEDIYDKNLVKKFRTVTRLDPRARLMQHTAFRILWFYGFNKNLKRLNKVVARTSGLQSECMIATVFS